MADHLVGPQRDKISRLFVIIVIDGHSHWERHNGYAYVHCNRPCDQTHLNQCHHSSVRQCTVVTVFNYFDCNGHAHIR